MMISSKECWVYFRVVLVNNKESEYEVAKRRPVTVPRTTEASTSELCHNNSSCGQPVIDAVR